MRIELSDSGIGKYCRVPNYQNFIDNYGQILLDPLVLANHVGCLNFGSEIPIIDERLTALSKYLEGDQRELKLNSKIISWGRTILAELVAQKMINQTFFDLTGSDKWRVVFTPTDIDNSIPVDNPAYQKGADLLLVETNGFGPVSPLCAFDITIGNRETVKSKRRRPGIQLPAAVGVAVVSLEYLSKVDGYDYPHYLDFPVRQEIFSKGSYTSFYGISKKSKHTWQHQIVERMMRGVFHCKRGISETNINKDFQNVAFYDHLEDVINNLDRVYEQLDDFRQNLVS